MVVTTTRALWAVCHTRHAPLCCTAASNYHVPVLRDELVEWLVTDPSGTYLDGTLGGGGHTEALLEAVKPHGGHVIGTDRDPDALASAGARLAPHTASGHATLLRSNFGALPDALRGLAGAPADGSGWLHGLLLDLGVSSHQLDEAGRGFSFMREGPLDMRMDQSSGGVGAAELINAWEPGAIADVLWQYGELRESRRLARAIVNARPLHTTAELAAVVTKAMPGPPKESTKRVARVFQALRIEVNAEMRELETALCAATTLIRPGGRLAIMSYHSLEDRRVKRMLRAGSFAADTPPRDAYGNVLAPWKTLTRQPVVASEAEIEANPRARSVRMRVGERTSHPALLQLVDL